MVVLTQRDDILDPVSPSTYLFRVKRLLRLDMGTVSGCGTADNTSVHDS